MNEAERTRKISELVAILRRTTVAVKIMPFAFVLAQMASIAIFMFTVNTDTALLDLMCYVSPLVILFEFFLSYSLKLCVWHRLECSLPLVPLVSVIVNDYICELTAFAETLNLSVLIFLFLASLLNGYKLFCKH